MPVGSPALRWLPNTDRTVGRKLVANCGLPPSLNASTRLSPST